MTTTWTSDISALQGEQERLFEHLGDPADEAGAVGAVNRAVVVRERQRQHQARDELAVLVDRLHTAARDAEDRDLRRVHERRKRGPADAAEVADAERRALHLLERQLAAARLRGQFGDLRRQLRQALAVRVAD